MTRALRTTECVLVFVDISGYTRFIRDRVITLEHAEDIISELLESLIDHASHPLQVNKLEGDAALLFAETQGDREACLRSVYQQLLALFPRFAARREQIQRERGHCACEACANIGALRLKALVHAGEIVIKQVRQFEELAGEPVILLHRLGKNRVPVDSYLLLTDAAAAPIIAAGGGWSSQIEPVADLDDVRVHWRPMPVDAEQPNPDGA